MENGPRSTAGDGTRTAPAEVTVRYWAGARAAAGVEAETRPAAPTVGELARALRADHPALVPVLEVSTLLVDGRAAGPDTVLDPGAQVEVLPPFAGG